MDAAVRALGRHTDQEALLRAKLRSGHFQEWQVVALDILGHPVFGDGVRKVGWEKWRFLENWKFLQSLPVPLLTLFAVSCAEHVLPIWIMECPDDQRPPEALQAAEDFLGGKITVEELKEKEAEAWYASMDGEASAEALCVARAASWAAWAVAHRSDVAVVQAAEAAGAASPAEAEWQFQELTKLILSWVKED